MSGATWFQQLVAQLGYQPCTMKVTINANEIFDVIPNIKSKSNGKSRQKPGNGSAGSLVNHAVNHFQRQDGSDLFSKLHTKSFLKFTKESVFYIMEFCVFVT